MLEITIPATEQWDEVTEQFVSTKEQRLQLEHSLVSLSKWESKWCKPFLSNKEKSHEEILDYIKCMTLTKNVDPEVYNVLTNENIKEINDYIMAPMTATTFSENGVRKKVNNEIFTSEVIYYAMTAYNIPFENCEKWHLNRLITLIRVCGIKNEPSKKMSKRSIMSQNAALNAARRKKFNTKG